MTPIPLSRPMTPELARAMYAVLAKENGLSPEKADDFVKAFEIGWRSFFFGGYGCLMIRDDSLSVECVHGKRCAQTLEAIDRTMRALAVLMEKE